MRMLLLILVTAHLSGTAFAFFPAETRIGTTGTKSTSRTFDALNRVLTRTDENGNVIGYRYYPSGKLKTLIYPGGTEAGTGRVDYTYWKSGQLYQVKDYLDSASTPRVTTYEWYADNRLKKITRANGSVREIKYDGAGRPEIIQELTAPLPSGKLIFVHKQGYHPSDELAWRYEMPAKRTSGLDPPAMGAMTYNADNQLATFQIPGQGVLTAVHDADGNMTSGPHPTANGLTTYGYDSRNRLTGALGYTFTYDAENQRTGYSVGGVSTTFVVDAGSALSKVLVRVKNGIRTRYVWGLGLQYEVNDAAQTTTYHYDASGSTIALTNSTGVIIERLGYTPWGSVNRRTTLTGTPLDTPFLYTGFFGTQTDPTGLHYLRARYYHPRIARFLNSDPARDGSNWYAFANGNPVNFGDPTGLGASGLVDAAQSVFSFLGMIPVVGAFFDVANAAISSARGNYGAAAFSLAAAIPGVGDILGGARLGSSAVRASGASYSVAASQAYRPAFAGTTAANSGSRLALPAARGVNEWKGPIQSIVTDGETLMYRVHGGTSPQVGQWLTPFKPASAASARSGLALPGTNTAEFVSEVWVPAGTRLQIGTAAPAFGQAGGGVQVQLLEHIPLPNFGSPVPLR